MFIFKRALIFSLMALMFSFVFSQEKGRKIIYLQKSDSGSDFSGEGFYRKGSSYIERQLTISFDKPVFKLSDIDAMKGEVQQKVKLAFTPAVRGEFRVIGTKQVNFVFREQLKPATRYTVSINAKEIKSVNGEDVTVMINHVSLEDNQVYEFTTPSLKVLNARTGEYLNDPVMIYFNMPVDPLDLKKR